VLFIDWHEEQLSASVTVDANGDEFLTVNTMNTSTSCTMKLSAHIKHGAVLTDKVFGVFRFSPDGKFIMYMAEETVSPIHKFLYKGLYNKVPKVSRTFLW
jgi:hypothetical protein